MSTSTSSSPASTLDGRLLCACDTAYGILPNGTFQPQEIYVTGAGFSGTGAIQTFYAGVDNIDACLVGTTADGVILAFRGTLPPNTSDPASFFDWLNDFYAEPTTVTGIPGQVHSGFWDALDDLWPLLLPAVTTAVANGGGTPLPLYITGHSKGGALASLAAMRFAKQTSIAVTQVHTFASPHPADTTFATAYNALFTDTRWEYQDDIVPLLPPNQTVMELLTKIPWIGKYIQNWAAWDYTSVGTLSFINWSDQIVGESIVLDAERAWHLTELLVELKFGQIAHDHGAYCGNGYMDVIVPTGVCPVATEAQIASIVGTNITVTTPSNFVRTPTGNDNGN